MSRAQARVAALACALLLAVSALLWTIPPALPEVVLEAGPAAAPGAETAPEASPISYPSRESFLGIVQADPFSASRGPAETVRAAGPAQRGSGSFRLLGIVRSPEGSIALIESPAATAGAELYRIGETVGAYRLQEVGDSTVVLVGTGGRLVLRLDPANGSGR